MRMPSESDEWMRFAQEDLAAAFRLISDEDLPARLACFHAQQSAEKALKAALVAVKKPFPRTHDLLALVAIVPDTLRVRLTTVDLAILDPWAVDARYPGDLPDIERSEAAGVIDVAELTVAIVVELLPLL